MTEKINLTAKLAPLDRPYEPGIVGYINDYKVQVAKIKGPFVWHKGDETGELFVVPRAAEHCPDAADEAEVLLIEPKGTVNTGDAGGEMTAEPRILCDR